MREIEIITQTTSDLTTLSDLKAYLGIDNSDSDTELETLIKSVSAFIQNETDQQIVETEYKEYIDGEYTESIVLSQKPIISVESLTIDDEEETDYYLYKKSGIIKRKSVGFNIWPDDNPKYRFPEGKQNIVIEYTAGYSEIPYDLQKAVWDIIKSARERKDYAGLSKYTIGDESITWSKGAVPSEAMDTIMNYKSVI